MIQLTQLMKTYDGQKVVADLDFAVRRGELVALVGESGCGKTTTLKMINRLIEPTSGRIVIDGSDIAEIDGPKLRRGIGYVFQGIGLFPHLTIAQNVAVVPRLLGWAERETRLRVEELLAILHLPVETYGDRLPRELSGGQKQRIGLARALAARPRIVLMDEPFSAIDPVNRDRLQVEFRKLHETAALTTVMVTHDMTEALLMADRIAVMLLGRIVQIGTPHEIMTAAAHPYVEQLMTTPRRQAQALARLADAELKETQR